MSCRQTRGADGSLRLVSWRVDSLTFGCCPLARFSKSLALGLVSGCPFH